VRERDGATGTSKLDEQQISICNRLVILNRLCGDGNGSQLDYRPEPESHAETVIPRAFLARGICCAHRETADPPLRIETVDTTRAWLRSEGMTVTRVGRGFMYVK
jgi:hypothetical protein